MQFSTFGPLEQSTYACTEAVRAIIKKTDSPRVCLCFLPIQSDHTAILNALCAATDVPIIGATTGGAGFTERGHTTDGIVGGVLGGSRCSVQVAVARGISTTPIESIETAVNQLNPEAGGSHTLLGLADAFACDGEMFVATLRRSTPVHWRYFGGTAGDNWQFTGTKVFYRDQALSDAAVLALIQTERPLSMGVNHGWRIAEGARKYIITDIENNILKELDGRPAADVYMEELQRLGFMKEGEDPVKKLATFELGMTTPFGEGLKIRAPLAINENAGITMASSLKKGDQVCVVRASSEDLLSAAASLSDKVLTPLDGRVQGQLVFDCAARLQLLGGHYGEEVTALHGPGNHPMLGYTCYGEIAKFGGCIEGFHNTTAVMAAW